MSARTALGSDSYRAFGYIDVIVNGDYIPGRNLEKIRDLQKALAGIVHVGRRLDDDDILSFDLSFSPQTFVLLFSEKNVMLIREHIHSEIAHVVPSIKILFSRITEPGYYPHKILTASDLRTSVVKPYVVLASHTALIRNPVILVELLGSSDTE